MRPSRRLYLSFLYLLLISSSLPAQIVINEFSAANSSTIKDENGNYGDWIELYNAGNSAVNIYKYKLSDDPLFPSKWQFPRIIIPANGLLTVFADDTSKLTYYDHWETPLSASDFWRYIIPNSSTDTNWRNSSFNDVSWNIGNGGFGYGDNDDSTLIPANSVSVYLRKLFTITDTSEIIKAVFNIDFDDGFVAYLNGIEIARSNLGTIGVRPAYNSFAILDREAKMKNGLAPDSFFVDINKLRKSLKNGNNILAVEVHNVSSNSSDFSAIPFFTLCRASSNYVFPYPPEWFKGRPREYLHANFKLSKAGDIIVLSDSLGIVLDQKSTGAMPVDVSYGRSINGAANWCYFSPASPNSNNNSINCYSGFSNPPIFSISGGFYDSPRLLSLNATPSNSVIRYTTDGSTPTASSALYLSSISVDTTQTIRASVFNAGLIPSQAITNTYFIDEDFHLPIFSLNTTPDNLWNDSTGIYVLGFNASPVSPYRGANFWQDWKKPVSVEYFDKQKNRVFEFNADFKINGNYSRAKPQKSFEVLLDNDYGISEITYPLITEKKNIKSYGAFVLRNAGTDWNVVHFRDGLMQRIMKDTHTGFLGHEPCEVFLNGQYWGVYEIRDNDNHNYVENNFGLKDSEFDLISEGRYLEAKNGSDTGFFNMYNYALTANPLDYSFYTKMNSIIDLENYADYFIAETYYVNNDWIGDWSNNIKLWRPNKGGGKWQYILYDLDFGMGLYSSHSYDKLNDLISPSDHNYQSDIFNSMITNPIFRTNFINRYADLINTIYLPANVNKIAYQMRDSIASEMPQQFARWGSSMTTWAQNISKLINFSNKRPTNALNFIQSNFDLASQVVLTLQAYPLGAGRIQISTIIPDSLPWNGTYFNGNPVTITAIPNPGYSFDYWKPSNCISASDSNQAITLNFTSNDSVVAYFVGSSTIPHITFSEINYQSNDSTDAGDWVEFHNLDSIDYDLTGWKFRDNDDLHTYTFQLGTVLEANSFIVLAEDTTKFSSQFKVASTNLSNSSSHSDKNYYEVKNRIGPIGFGFTNTGELLRLFDYKDSLYVSMSYSKLPPWPLAAAGQGFTLESVPNNSDLDNGDNWFTGCPGGSPGTFYLPTVAKVLADSVEILCVEDSIILSAQSGNNYFYKWYKNEIELPNESASTLVVSDSAFYKVKVTRLGCEEISSQVKVNLKSLPLAHINSPLSTFVCEGNSLLISADSVAGQSYEWVKNDTVLMSFTQTQLSVADSGLFYVNVTLNGCSKKSEIVEVNYNPVPDASLQNDTSYEFCDGLQQTLSAPSIAGYTYSWFKNDTLIAGATAADYFANQEGLFEFETSLNGCSKRSQAISISLLEAPKTFLIQLDTLVLCLGETTVLNAYQDSSYTYQWLKNDTLILGADSASYPIIEAGLYKLITHNAICSSFSTVQVLTHPAPQPVINLDSSLLICAGNSYQLKVGNGIGQTYQWFKNSTAIPGANDFKYVVSDSGHYSVLVNLNSCQNLSNAIQVSIHKLPINTIIASDTTLFCSGSFVDLVSNQSNGFNYQWYRNGASIAGEVNAIYRATQTGSYTIIQSDSLCSNVSNSVSVNVKSTPLAVVLPIGSTHLCNGESTILNAAIDTNYSYEWFKNNSLLAGNSTSQLTVSDAGYYAVQITADACYRKSDSIVVSQNQVIDVSILSADTTTICEGSVHLFSIDVDSTLNYQWFYNGAFIPFAKDTFYAASSIGNYSVLASDSFCSHTSTEKTILKYNATAVSLSSFNAACLNDSAFALSGGIPLGGNYNGNGISANVFDPSIAGVGINSMQYTYVDSNQCAASATSFIEVKSLSTSPVITQNFNVLESSSLSGNQWYFNDTLITGATQQSYVPTQNGLYSVLVEDTSFCNSLPTYYTYLSLSTIENANTTAFSIYPNPSNGTITVTLAKAYSGSMQLFIFDVLGQEIYAEQSSIQNAYDKKISLEKIIPGMYVVRIKLGENTFDQKLIVR